MDVLECVFGALVLSDPRTDRQRLRNEIETARRSGEPKPPAGGLGHLERKYACGRTDMMRPVSGGRLRSAGRRR